MLCLRPHNPPPRSFSNRAIVGAIAGALLLFVAVTQLGIVLVRGAMGWGEARAAQRLAAAGTVAPGHVIVYGSASCGACKSAKKWLEAKGVAYEYRALEDEKNLDLLEHEAHIPKGRVSIPVIGIDGEYRQGFDPAWLERSLARAPGG